MRSNRMASALTVACATACLTLLLTACDDPTTSPPGRSEADAASAASLREARVAAADAALLAGEPFTARAPLDPYFINQAPDFMIRSKARTDLVIQRLVTPAGAGAWHTHPGPSFAIVEQGQVMITRYSKRGCTTEVYGPGQTYFEVADQVHRATVLSAGGAVEYKVRLNVPVGGPLSTPANDPGC